MAPVRIIITNKGEGGGFGESRSFVLQICAQCGPASFRRASEVPSVCNYYIIYIIYIRKSLSPQALLR